MNDKRPLKKTTLVSAVIMCLAAGLALLIAWNFIPKAVSPQPPAAVSPNAAGQGGQRAQGGAAAGQQGQGRRQEQGGAGSRNAVVVRVTPVAPGTIENSVVINGDVLALNQVSIFPTAGGKLVEARFGIGDRVNRGDIVAMIDPSRPGEVYSRSPVISTISGTVLQAPYSTGDTLSTQQAVYVIGDLSSLRIETFVPERFVSSIKQGLGAQVRLESIPGESFYAEVDEVSPVLDPSSRTMRIRLRFTSRPRGTGAADPRIKAGMFATISLVTNTRANVPVIPRAAVINTYGSWIVFIVDENGIARRRELELGLENEELFEILSGAAMGERVVSQGQNFLSDGDPVRIAE